MFNISFFHRSASHLVLHSFPTRRSSDLIAPARPASACIGCAWANPIGTSIPTASTTPPSASPSASRRTRSEEHTSELQSRGHLVCRLLLEKKKTRCLLIHRSTLLLQLRL